MADAAATAPKPSSSVKLVLLGEAAVGKVTPRKHLHSATAPRRLQQLTMNLNSPLLSSDS